MKLYYFEFENFWNTLYSVTVRDGVSGVTYGFLYRLRRQRVGEPGGMSDRTRATSCSLACKVRVVRTMSGRRESSLLAVELELAKQVTGNHSSKRKAIFLITECYRIITSDFPSFCL